MSVKLEQNWKRFQRKPSALNTEEQSLPLSASYVLPNLVNLTLLCSKLSVSPGHTADSRSCPSGPASLFLQRCHLASCSQNGSPIQSARCHCLCHHTILAGPFFQNAQVPLNGSPVLLQCPGCFSHPDVTRERAEGTFSPTTEVTDEDVGQSSSSIKP